MQEVDVATYIMLLTLTPEGQSKALHDPDYLLAIEAEIEGSDVQTLGLYAVLGQYDFVSIVEAAGNEAVARFSIELGVRAGVHVMTLPVIPATRLAGETPALAAEVALEVPREAAEEDGSRSLLPGAQ
jgi:uncharacterized protein with GYD domain